MCRWTDLLSREELDAQYALCATIDPAFARQDREWWESRTIPQLRVLRAQAWNIPDGDQWQRACSYLALAGYNGGPYNIKSLILAKPAMPLDVFIESLSTEETVNYVKRIIESRYIYESAYLGRAVRPDLSGPLPSPRPSLPDF